MLSPRSIFVAPGSSNAASSGYRQALPIYGTWFHGTTDLVSRWRCNVPAESPALLVLLAGGDRRVAWLMQGAGRRQVSSWDFVFSAVGSSHLKSPQRTKERPDFRMSTQSISCHIILNRGAVAARSQRSVVLQLDRARSPDARAYAAEPGLTERVTKKVKTSLRPMTHKNDRKAVACWCGQLRVTL